MKKLKYIIYILTVSFLVACSSKSETDKKSQLEKLKAEQTKLKEQISKLEAEIAATDTGALALKAEKVKMVGITAMQPDTFRHYIEIQGKVEGDKDVSMSPQMPGKVLSINVSPGDVVTKGQLLASLEDNGLNETVAEIRTQLDLAKTVYKRQKNLWDQGIGSEVQFLQAKTNKEALERRLASVKEQWDMTQLTSPINGTIDEVNIKEGQTVAPGMAAIRVVNFSSMKAKGEVAESYISEVNKGNEVIIYFPDQQREITSKITYSGKAINRLNRTFNVEVDLTPKDGEVHPNQVAVLKIIDYVSPNTFIVPVGAIQKSLDGEFVYIVRNENGNTVARRRTIISGMTYNGFTEVKGGLTEGDKVITNGYQNIIEGDLINF